MVIGATLLQNLKVVDQPLLPSTVPTENRHSLLLGVRAPTRASRIAEVNGVFPRDQLRSTVSCQVYQAYVVDHNHIMHVSLSLLIPFLTVCHGRVLESFLQDSMRSHSSILNWPLRVRVLSHVTQEIFSILTNLLTSYILPFLTWHPQVLASTSLIAVGA